MTGLPAGGADLQKELVDVCNKIFRRNVLPVNRLQGNALKLDLSMRKIVVFAQGGRSISARRQGQTDRQNAGQRQAYLQRAERRQRTECAEKHHKAETLFGRDLSAYKRPLF